MSKIFCHTFSLVIVLFCVGGAFGATNQQDANVLSGLKSSFQDPQQALTSWQGNDPCGSQWVGVTCSSENRVVQLSLPSKGLGGSISGQIGQLSSLTLINFGGNLITGSIPQEMGQLSQLMYLYLNNTQLSGTLPDSLSQCLSLLELRLNNNAFTGQVPYGYTQLKQLRLLDLSSNHFTQEIPYDFSSIPTLEAVYLQNNNFSGTIPNKFGTAPKNLQILVLYNNRLTGSIPQELGQLGSLRGLYLQQNNLTGSITDALGNITSLQELFLDDNQLTGNIPSALGNLVSLTTLVLSNNQFTGSLPDSVGSLPNLKILYVDNNQLTGSIPASYSHITAFSFCGNNFCSNTIGATCSGACQGSCGTCAQSSGTVNPSAAPGSTVSASTVAPTCQCFAPQVKRPQTSGNSSQGSCDCVYPATVVLRLVDKQLSDWTSLQQSFPSDLCSRLGLQTQQCQVVSAVSGSIVVTTNITPLTGTSVDSATFQRLNSTLYSGSNALDSSKYGNIQVTSVKQSSSSAPPSSSGSGGSSLGVGKIAGIAAAGFAVIIVIGLIAIWALITYRKNNQGKLPVARPAKSPSKSPSRSASKKGSEPPEALPPGSVIDIKVVSPTANSVPPPPLLLSSARTPSPSRMWSRSKEPPTSPLNGSQTPEITPPPTLPAINTVRSPSPRPIPPPIPMKMPSKKETKKERKQREKDEKLAAKQAPSKGANLRALQEKVMAKVFDASTLRLATNNFSRGNLLGEGGLGRVYRADIDGETFTAKVLDSNVGSNEVLFLTELAVISSLHHQNVVELVGYCSEGPQHTLVYEFIGNGTLLEHLHAGIDGDRGIPITWNARMKIGLGIARALEYLHHGVEPPVLHRSLKTANILMDQDMNPHLSDCGLAKLSGVGENRGVSTQMLGTFGYAAPEFTMTGVHTLKTDTYSFGVVLLELLTGRRPVDSTRPRAEQSLVRWAVPQLHDEDELIDIVDPELEGRYPSKTLVKFADIIADCLQPEAEFRPSMAEVVQKLQPLVPFSSFSSRGRMSPTSRLSPSQRGRASPARSLSESQ